MTIATNDSSRERKIPAFAAARVVSVIMLALLSPLVPVASAQKITTTVLPDGKVGVVYATQLEGTGGKTPYRWYSASSLPMGLSLALNGYLSGIPATPGTFMLSLRMLTANNKTTSKTLTLTIAPDSPPRITTLTIPRQTVGIPFSFEIRVEGGVPPYKCEPDDDNNLAEFGLVLDPTCILFGTPTKDGEVHF